MNIKYDKGSDAAYIEFDVDQNKTMEFDHVEGEWPINIDISKDGRVMGIEILEASSILNRELLENS